MVSRQDLLMGLQLKSVARAGWILAGINSPESVAAHSWGMAFLASQICPTGIDRAKVIEMCVVHDLAEVIIGDITPHDGISATEKHRLEQEAYVTLKLIGATRILLEEYEEQVTEEARFTRFLDRLDMALQAGVYESREKSEAVDLSEFKQSVKEMAEEFGFSNLLD
jgi:putative hydrolase of HD superfamily